MIKADFQDHNEVPENRLFLFGESNAPPDVFVLLDCFE